MLNIQTFTDTDGNQVEIDRRNVRDAYMTVVGSTRAIAILLNDGRTLDLGAGARDFVETWLGHPIDAWRLKSTVAAAYSPNPKPVTATLKDQAWLDARLAQMRDEAIVRLGQAAAARDITALAMVVLHPPIDPVPAQHQRAFQLLKQAHAALVIVAGSGNDVRTTVDYPHAVADECEHLAAMKGRETITIGGKDYSDTDPETRAIIDHLAGQGVTEQAIARTSYRVLVNMILRAQQEIAVQKAGAQS